MNLGATMTISHFPKSFVETNLTMKGLGETVGHNIECHSSARDYNVYFASVPVSSRGDK